MELFRALAAFSEPPTSQHELLAALLGLPAAPDAAEYTNLFLFQLYPFASVYLGPEGQLGGEARDRVAGFWRAIGRTPPPEPDHLAVLLSLYATLAEHEQEESDAARRLLRRRARAALLWEHIASWLPPFLTKLDEIASPAYRAWGRLLEGALRREAEALGPPDSLPSQLREPDPDAGPDLQGDGFLESILAPGRSGMILVQADLRRAADELGLGLRVGERRFALKALLGQDQEAMLAWLRREAESWERRHRAWGEPFEGISEVWAKSARCTADRLAELLSEVAASGAGGMDR